MRETNVPPAPRDAASANNPLLAEQVRGDPRYAETANRFGHERARLLVAHYGREALSDSFQHTTPIELDHSKEVLARLDLFNRVASQMEGRPTSEVQRRADTVWDGLTASQRAQLASDPGSSASILSDIDKGPLGFRHHPAPGNDGTDAAKGGFYNGQFYLAGDVSLAGGKSLAGSGNHETAAGSNGAGGSRRANYAAMDGTYNPEKGISSITNESSFGASPYSASGLSYAQFQAMRPTITNLLAQGYRPETIKSAMFDTTKLGESPTDKEALKDHAAIRRYDPKADEFVGQEKDLQERMKNDPDLAALVLQEQNEKDPNKRKALHEQIEDHVKRHRRDSGTDDHIRGVNDSNAKAAEARDVERIVKKHKDDCLKAGAKLGLTGADLVAYRKGDPEAIKKVRAIQDETKADPEKSKAMKIIEHGFEKSSGVGRSVDAEQTNVVGKKDKIEKKNEDLLADLNGPSPAQGELAKPDDKKKKLVVASNGRASGPA